MYARDLAEFEENYEAWVEEVDGVEIRVGVGENIKYVPVLDYYSKNWEPCRSMWARFERKSLPLGEEHTTNRLERAFGVLKGEMKVNNHNTDITIEKAIVEIVSWAERKLTDGFTSSQRKAELERWSLKGK